jgi:hypothetical protein
MLYEEVVHDSGKVDLQEQETMDVEKLVNLCTHIGKRCPGFKEFGFIEIVNGTENFSEKRIIGRGGYGTVYKVHNNRDFKHRFVKRVPSKPNK